jgi:hypothetical protein
MAGVTVAAGSAGVGSKTAGVEVMIGDGVMGMSVTEGFDGDMADDLLLSWQPTAASRAMAKAGSMYFM